MKTLDSKKYTKLSERDMQFIAGGKKKWVTIDTITGWRCYDGDCNAIISYTVQMQELQNNQGKVFGYRTIPDDF